jgi:hypothetical protein
MSTLDEWYMWLSERRLQQPTSHRFMGYELELGHGQDDGLVAWRFYWPYADSQLNAARVIGWGYIRGTFLVLNRWQLIEDESQLRSEQIAEHLDNLRTWDQTEYVIKHYDLGAPVVWRVETERPVTSPDEVTGLRETCRKSRLLQSIHTLPRSPMMRDESRLISLKADSRESSAPVRFVFVEASPFYESLLGE